MSSRNRFTINAACQPIVENVCASSVKANLLVFEQLNTGASDDFHQSVES